MFKEKTTTRVFEQSWKKDDFLKNEATRRAACVSYFWKSDLDARYGRVTKKSYSDIGFKLPSDLKILSLVETLHLRVQYVLAETPSGQRLHFFSDNAGKTYKELP